jgi:hypothetical protein
VNRTTALPRPARARSRTLRGRGRHRRDSPRRAPRRPRRGARSARRLEPEEREDWAGDGPEQWSERSRGERTVKLRTPGRRGPTELAG